MFYERTILVKPGTQIMWERSLLALGMLRAISDTIVRFLSDVNLDNRNARPQCYDWVANMSGKYNGVQEKNVHSLQNLLTFIAKHSH